MGRVKEEVESASPWPRVTDATLEAIRLNLGHSAKGERVLAPSPCMQVLTPYY